jgi:hypothetical protein
MDTLVASKKPSEMEIVDTFTKLIFGVQQDYSDSELAIIQVLRQVDGNIALDGREAMGVYLRALGVSEMIKLVSRVYQGYPPSGQTLFPASPGQRARL